MLSHPDVLLKIVAFQHQDDIREAELWQLAKQARQERTFYLYRLAQRVIAPAGRLVSSLLSRPNSPYTTTGR